MKPFLFISLLCTLSGLYALNSWQKIIFNIISIGHLIKLFYNLHQFKLKNVPPAIETTNVIVDDILT